MDEFAADLLTLTDDDGVETEFQILDQIDTDEGHFMALLPVEEADDEDENGSYYILREDEDENGESRTKRCSIGWRRFLRRTLTRCTPTTKKTATRNNSALRCVYCW